MTEQPDDPKRRESSSEDLIDGSTDRPLPMRFYGRQPKWRLIDLAELWQYRDLLVSLMLRDFQVQYRQTGIGIAWAIIRPLTMMIVFTTFFRWLGRVPAEDARLYAIVVYCGQLPWQLFSSSVTKSTRSLVINKEILTKVYFPRLILPIVPLGVGLVDFLVGFLVLCGLMVYHQVVPGIGFLFLPCFVLLALAAAFSISTWLSAANALYRDIEQAVPFLLQCGMFLSPVVYEMQSVVPEKWQWLYALNPMVGVLEGFRWAILGSSAPPVVPLLSSVVITVALLIGGTAYFRRVERFVADRI